MKTADQEANDETLNGEVADETLDNGTEDGAGEEGGEGGAVDTGEVTITIGEETPPQDEEAEAPQWVRDLRKNYRELQKKNKELDAQVKAATKTEANPVTLGKKPELKDFEFDTEKFEQELEKWHDQKRAVEAARQRSVDAENKQKEAWQATLNTYGSAKAALKVKDFPDAEAATEETLSVIQQSIILQGAENSAMVVYAIGKNPARAKELALITDPVKFAFAVAKLETQLKVQNRKAATPPEDLPANGTGQKSGGADVQLERLRAQAEKTGDYSAVTSYRRNKRAAK